RLWYRRLLQRPQLRPDADVAHRAAAARARAARRRPHPARPSARRGAAAVSAELYPQHADPAVEWTGAKRRYDLVKEATIALLAVGALTILLSVIFSSPDVKPVTVSSWATKAPQDFLATAVSELDGTSGIATY